MRKNQTQTISEVISQLMKEKGFENKLLEVSLIRFWEELLGKTVARYTKHISIKNNTLYVTLTSSIVRNEIMLIRDELIGKLNEKAGKNFIEKIVLK
jgi:predicted nucleic acid-binding Zn ribbon protein